MHWNIVLWRRQGLSPGALSDITQTLLFFSLITKYFTSYGLLLRVFLFACQILACVVKQLETAGFFSESITKSRPFVTVHDAVLYILKKWSQTDLILVSSLLWIFSTVKYCNIVWRFSALKTIFSRMFPQAQRCDQQRSDCFNSSSSSSPAAGSSIMGVKNYWKSP